LKYGTDNKKAQLFSSVRALRGLPLTGPLSTAHMVGMSQNFVANFTRFPAVQTFLKSVK